MTVNPALTTHRSWAVGACRSLCDNAALQGFRKCSYRLAAKALQMAVLWRRRESNPRFVSTVNLRDEWGLRLASLADGEGCFVIGRSNAQKPGGGSYRCSFNVKLRADDEPFLHLFADQFGGRIYSINSPSIRADGHARAPQVHWKIETKAGCRGLVDVFDEFPLWSKKQRDYALWREAVLFWHAVEGRHNDWAPMRHLFDEIKAVREYVA